MAAEACDRPTNIECMQQAAAEGHHSQLWILWAATVCPCSNSCKIGVTGQCPEPLSIVPHSAALEAALEAGDQIEQSTGQGKERHISMCSWQLDRAHTLVCRLCTLHWTPYTARWGTCLHLPASCAVCKQHAGSALYPVMQDP